MYDSRRLFRSCAHGLLAALMFVSLVPAADDHALPLHDRIDRLIESTQVGPPAAIASDDEFLRRVSLDLTGMPPGVDELKNFLADQTTGKRARKVDRLLASPLFARHWATTLDIMLMERRPYVNVSAEVWQGYLLAAAQSNRPLNHVLSELLTESGADQEHRAAARFFLDRGSEPNLITRDVGRIFFGRDMQCAQCHNHPLVKDYQQSDYYGLLAFISPGYPVTRKEGKTDVTVHAETAGGDLAYDSVFVKNDKHVTGPRILGETEFAEPAFPPGDEYHVKPADGVMSVPKFSRRAKLASLTTGGANRAFNLNIANRLWAVMMGRGLVHPVDLHHPSNPPSHPELLKLLADEIVARNFNVRDFLRELALTRVYQQSIDLPDETSELPAALTTRLAEHQARAELLEAAAENARKSYAKAVKAWHKIEESLVPLVAEKDKLTVKYAEAVKKDEAARKAVADGESQIAARRDTAQALAEATARAQDVVKKLPKDKELVDAAATFTRRHAAATAELAALEKAAVASKDARKKAGDLVIAAASAIEAARTKIQPVRESVRSQEQLVLAARKKMADSRSAAEDNQKRLKLLEAFAHYKSTQEQAAASDRAVVQRRDALMAAGKTAGELETVLKQRQTEATTGEPASLAAMQRNPTVARNRLLRSMPETTTASKRPLRRPRPRDSFYPTIPPFRRQPRKSRRNRSTSKKRKPAAEGPRRCPCRRRPRQEPPKITTRPRRPSRLAWMKRSGARAPKIPASLPWPMKNPAVRPRIPSSPTPPVSSPPSGAITLSRPSSSRSLPNRCAGAFSKSPASTTAT